MLAAERRNYPRKLFTVFCYRECWIWDSSNPAATRRPRAERARRGPSRWRNRKWRRGGAWPRRGRGLLRSESRPALGAAAEPDRARLTPSGWLSLTFVLPPPPPPTLSCRSSPPTPSSRMWVSGTGVEEIFLPGRKRAAAALKGSRHGLRAQSRVGPRRPPFPGEISSVGEANPCPPAEDGRRREALLFRPVPGLPSRQGGRSPSG